MPDNRTARAFSFRAVTLLAFLACLLPAPAALSQECLDCHGDKSLLSPKTPGRTADQLFVAADALKASVHQDVGCADCHQDAVLKDSEHPADLKPVDCGMCHDKEAGIYANSTHGKKLAAGDSLAPRCSDCHGTHQVLPPQNRNSKNYRMNIPSVCGTCHAEGHSVAQQRKLGEDGVVEAYKESIHFEGVFKRGLLGAAVCSDCHGAHDVLPHEDPASKINRTQVPGTCMTCHAEIEKVHVKVINEKLWEDKPGAIPVCIDCHSPHRIRRVKYADSVSDNDCMACHGRSDIKAPDGRSLTVDARQVHDSAHVKVTCAMCHSNLLPGDNPPCKHVGKVECSKCHEQQAAVHASSIHGKLHAQGNEQAPDCITCHGTHGVLPRSVESSPTSVRNIPTLCARCHRAGEAAAVLRHGEIDGITQSYTESIHGKGLLESGLLVTAVCTSCHTAHGPLPKTDPNSTVAPARVAGTCGKCHAGVFEEFRESIHSPSVSTSGEPLPACNDCHSSHTISRVDSSDFRFAILDRCGKCHKALTEAYFETYHGKASRLGGRAVAECGDCHSAHRILAPEDPRSTLSRENIVATCGKCHEGSHRQFAGYLTHATHKDSTKYPILYYTFLFMTLLLLGTLAFFTLHTLLWLPRSFKLALERRRHPKPADEPYVRRFRPYHRWLHLIVILSFFGLALTGMALKFSYAEWAQALARAFGGQESAAAVHRFCAILTFVYFGLHLAFLWNHKRESKLSLRRMLLHPESMLPNLRDFREFGQTLKWFIGRGPRPDYGRFTYWEKFDYFAVFWGVAVIGMTGLILWFPETFTRILPGWAVNVATIIHSDEALLAAGFIFSVHFFNTHFRPERFPMDPVIFTGAIPLSEFKEERPREYRQAVEAGTIESMFVARPSRSFVRWAHVFGLSMLTIGLTLIALIVYAMYVAYR
jgi:cytochrome b subunit of formate dehydrogenase